jgi:site-specific DNA recombinase
MTRAAIWIRVSTEDQAKGESPATHLKRAEMYCELKGWQVVETYDLSGVSGKTVLDYPEARRMLADVERGHIKALIFSRLARLARNTRELLEISDLFKSHGAALVSLGESIDTSSPAGMLLYTVLGALAEWERNEISARVSAAVPIRAAQGKPTGGVGPWGYRWNNKTLEVDPEAAEKVRVIFALCLEEEGNKSRTVKRLNAMGLRSREGAVWTVTNLTRLIDNHVYTGRRRANYARSTGDGKHWVEKPESDWVYHAVEPIIEPGLWDKLQAFRKQRRRSEMAPPKESKYIFGGLLQCVCGKKLYVSHATAKDIIYRCRACQYKVAESDLTSGLLQALQNMAIKAEVETEGEDPKVLFERAALIQKEAEKVKQKKARILDLYSDGKETRDSVLPKLKELEEQQSRLETEFLQVEEEAEYRRLELEGRAPLCAQVEKVSELWEYLDYDEQRQVVRKLVDKIELGEERTVFVLRLLPELGKSRNESHTPRGVKRFPEILYRVCVPNYLPEPATFGQQIILARKKAGWRQEDLAEWVGAAVVTVANWERGEWPVLERHRQALEMFLGEPLIRCLGDEIAGALERGDTLADLARVTGADLRSVRRWAQGLPPVRKVYRERLRKFLSS